MGGFFGVTARKQCRTDLFYGVDYNSHLGTRRAGMATYDREEGRFVRKIHSLESTYFRTKFENELNKFTGNSGIGIIADTTTDNYKFSSRQVCKRNCCKNLQY